MFRNTLCLISRSSFMRIALALWVFGSAALCAAQSGDYGNPPTTCVVPAPCSSISACNSISGSKGVMWLEQHPNGSGIVWNRITGTVFQSKYTLSSQSLNSTGDTWMTNWQQSTIGSINSVGVQCGFTVFEYVYLDPSSSQLNVPLASFDTTAGGGTSILAFDGIHFNLLNSINTGVAGQTRPVWVQTFWDPKVTSAGWYGIAYTVTPDLKGVLDVLSYNASSNSKFSWQEGRLDAAWPAIYTLTGTTGTKVPMPSSVTNAAVNVGLGEPVVSGSNRTFAQDGFPLLTSSLNLAYFGVFNQPMSSDQVIAWWSGATNQKGGFNPTWSGSSLLADSNLQGSNAPNDAALHPCNSGAFLHGLSAGGANYINTPCQLNKPKTYPPALPLLVTPMTLNDPFPKTVTVKNVDTSATLKVIDTFLSGTQYYAFSYTSDCVQNVLAPGASCSFRVGRVNKYACTTVQYCYGNITIQTDGGATNSPTISLQSGRPGTPTFSSSSLTFGPLNISGGNTSPPQTVTMTNSDPANGLVVSSISLTGQMPGDFAETDNCTGTTLAPGASCAINITYQPQNPENSSATLNVNDSSVTSPDQVQLSGSSYGTPQ
jgi:hypothetical protein